MAELLIANLTIDAIEAAEARELRKAKAKAKSK
jgi:hypothetical protein